MIILPLVFYYYQEGLDIHLSLLVDTYNLSASSSYLLG